MRFFSNIRRWAGTSQCCCLNRIYRTNQWPLPFRPIECQSIRCPIPTFMQHMPSVRSIFDCFRFSKSFAWLIPCVPQRRIERDDEKKKEERETENCWLSPNQHENWNVLQNQKLPDNQQLNEKKKTCTRKMLLLRGRKNQNISVSSENFESCSKVSEQEKRKKKHTRASKT